MNETQRQEYLKTMGIQSYFPRVVLPGAKPSPEYDFDETPDSDEPSLSAIASAVKRPVENVSDSKGSSASSGNSVLDELRAGATTSRKPAISPEKEDLTVQSGSAGRDSTTDEALDKEGSTEEAAELRFSLNYYKITPTLALVNEVPHQNASNQDAQIMALMKAILLALSIDVEVSALRAENFSWPLSADLDLDSNSAELASKALSGFMQMRQHKDQFGDLLVFAARSEELILGEDSSLRDFKSACESFNLTVTKSLHSMLVHPALKKEVWQDLQPLRRRLAESE